MWWIITITLTLILLIIHPLILRKYTKNTLCLNTDRLHLQYFFQIALFIPFIFSVFLMCWVGREYPPRWDSIGFNFFLDIQKLPLGILALSPILAAFVVYAHRSLQTENQIKTAEKQLEEAQNKNKSDIYYLKRKFINEQLLSITTANNEKINRPTSLYLKSFEIGNLNDKKLDIIIDEMENHLQSLDTLTILNDTFNTLDSFVICVNNIENKKQLDEISSRFIEVDHYISNIKIDLYIENKLSIYDEYKKTLSEYAEIYKNNKEQIDTGDFSTDLYLDIKYKYINIYVNAIYYLSDVVNIISEVIIILYPDDNINSMLPSLKKAKSIITEHQEGLMNLY
ncbi:TPA: hypothetical protein SLE56_003882 [Morganella morganii]|nr:hypothetical protein [Morganella morganii]